MPASIPLPLWLPLSLGLCILLVLAAMVWVLRQARAVPAASRDGRNARRIAALAALGLLLWLAYAGGKAYAGLWQADALRLMAQSSALLQVPLIVGGIAWAAALLLGRLIRLHRGMHDAGSGDRE